MTKDAAPPKWRPHTARRVFAKKTDALRWLLHLLEGGFFAKRFAFLRREAPPVSFDGGEGAPDEIPPEIVRRAKAKIGRPRTRKKKGETRDDQIRRLNAARQARYRARQRQKKETSR